MRFEKVDDRFADMLSLDHIGFKLRRMIAQLLG